MRPLTIKCLNPTCFSNKFHPVYWADEELCQGFKYFMCGKCLMYISQYSGEVTPSESHFYAQYMILYDTTFVWTLDRSGQFYVQNKYTRERKWFLNEPLYFKKQSKLAQLSSFI